MWHPLGDLNKSACSTAGEDDSTRQPAVLQFQVEKWSQLLPQHLKQVLKCAGKPNKSTCSDLWTAGNDDLTRSIEGAAVSSRKISHNICSQTR